MQTKPKSNSIITHSRDDEAGTLTFHVKDGGEPIVVNLGALSAPVRAEAMIYGLIQRGSDRAAMSRDPETGQPATPAEKAARIRAWAEHVNSGATEWNIRAAGGGSGRRASLHPVIAALATIQGMDYSAMAERVKANAEKRRMTEKAYLAIVGAEPAVQAKIAELAGAEKGVSAADLMADFDDEGE